MEVGQRAENVIEFYKKLKQLKFRFTTDSRKLEKDCVYFALKGPNFNGNDFALECLHNGAAIAVVDDADLKDKSGCYYVEDVLTFLQQLARHHRDQFDIPVLAIGGSNGKTTTKELVHSVLSVEKKTHSTKGNLNNLIGVPITLLSMPEDTEIAVIEIGTNTFGEIEALCGIVNPNFGIITNIGKEHLEGFGDLEGVAREESELFHYLQKNEGLAFVNHEDEWLMRMAGRLERTFTYGSSAGAHVTVDLLNLAPEIHFRIQGQEGRSHLIGDYNFTNICAAVAIGRYFGVHVDSIIRGIDRYVPKNNRSEIREMNSNKLILDFYNANPSSMEAALESFAKLVHSEKYVILGDMFELGNSSESEHKALVQKVQELGLNNALFVGEAFFKVSEGEPVQRFRSNKEAIEYLSSLDLENHWILMKGSRGMKMEELVEAFEA